MKGLLTFEPKFSKKCGRAIELPGKKRRKEQMPRCQGRVVPGVLTDG